MSNLFYPKLAVTNIRKNGRTYFPYILTCIGSAAMYYMILALSRNPGLQTMRGGYAMSAILDLGSWVTAIFCVIFLFYTNSFLMKRRKKEFGLYNILGMEKKHIARVIGCETFFIGAGSLLTGLLAGILLYKLLFLGLVKILKTTITLGFEISWSSVASTCLLFAGIFLLILINSLAQIHLAKPIELLHGSAVGEKEPKSRWLLAIIGFGLLAAGYTISITTLNPIAALSRFFLAVLLVIFGTYFLFTAGSITLLKLLRRNKNYYYQTKHFISVSSMMYRMKKNAVGLANICILSTMLLVTVSTTLSMFMGIDDIIAARFPKNLSITMRAPTDESTAKMHEWMENTLAKNQLTPIKPVEYRFLSFDALQNGNQFAIDSSDANDVNNRIALVFLPLEDYNRSNGTSYSLKENEILMYSHQTNYQPNTLNVLNHEFQVKQKLSELEASTLIATEASLPIYIVVENPALLQQLDVQFMQEQEWNRSIQKMIYGFDLDAQPETIRSIESQLAGTMEQYQVEGYLESSESIWEEALGAYGGLFFIGIFLGSLFLMATILIIYYKQISEGYEDKERFRIMQQVGMNHTEVRKSIQSQVLTVFFLPLVTAVIHVAFAFPVVTRLLAVLNLTNVPLFTFYTFVCLGIFTIFYAIIYSATARTYYKIVK